MKTPAKKYLSVILLSLPFLLAGCDDDPPPQKTEIKIKKPTVNNAFVKKAEAGSAEIQTELAVIFRDGTGGVRKDGKKSMEWLKKALEQSYPPAQSIIGMQYYKGENSLTKDDVRALAWHEMAAKQDYAQSQSYLAIAYSYGLGTEKNELLSSSFAEKAATAGNIQAALLLAQNHLAKGNAAQAYKWFLLAQLRGDMRYAGKSKEGRDQIAPSMSFEELAAAEMAAVTFLPRNEGWKDSHGWKEIPQPEAPIVQNAAEKKLGAAANSGKVQAQYELAKAYEKTGFPLTKLSTIWYNQAALQDHPESLYMLCTQYAYGDNMLPRDLREAEALCKRASEYDNSYAQILLGAIYANGEDGVPKDDVKAFELWKKAAEQDNSLAFFTLAIAYANGFGTQENKAEALKYLMLVKNDEGLDLINRASTLINVMERKMTEKQIAEAKIQVKTFRPRATQPQISPKNQAQESEQESGQEKPQGAEQEPQNQTQNKE